MKKIALFSSICMLVLASSCIDNLKSITGSGNVVSQTRNVGPFSEVDAENGMDVIIEQGDVQSLVVEADDNLQEHILTTVNGNTLHITSDFNNFINSTRNIRIKMPKIDALTASSGVSLTSKGILKGTSIDLETNSGSSMTVEVEFEDVEGESSSGSTMKVSGKAMKASFSSSSGSTIEAGNLMANEVQADASSGSSINVKPIVKLKGEASSGGSVNYSGSPKEVIRDESSGGSVSGS